MPPRVKLKRNNSTSSGVKRMAIQPNITNDESGSALYESVKDVIGSVEGGDPKLSENIVRKFTELLQARAVKQRV